MVWNGVVCGVCPAYFELECYIVLIAYCSEMSYYISKYGIKWIQKATLLDLKVLVEAAACLLYVPVYIRTRA